MWVGVVSDTHNNIKNIEEIISLAEKKEDEWVLSPTKRHILENENVNRLQIEEKNENLSNKNKFDDDKYFHINFGVFLFGL